MARENEGSAWTSYAILLVAAAGCAGLIWRSYHNDAPRIENYTLPKDVPAAPQVETLGSLEARAEGHLAARRFGEAARTYRLMLVRQPKNAAILNELGLALHYDGKTAEAIETLRNATELDPKLQRAWLSRGFVLMSAGRSAEARAALKKTIALGASTPQGVEARSMLER